MENLNYTLVTMMNGSSNDTIYSYKRFNKQSLWLVSHQSGATLILSMIMLLMVTVLALSMTKSTQLGVKMVANDQFKNIAFQESEHAIEESINDYSYLSSTLTNSQISGTSNWNSRSVNTASSSNGFLDSTTDAQFIGISVPDGTSAGVGADSFQHYHYQVRGRSSLENNGATNTNVRGAYIIGAKSN